MHDHGTDGPLPPRREQLPLPRRDEQTHLEPQLREPGGTGAGTPFAAFGAAENGAGPDDALPTPPSGARAAAFREATRRAAGRSRDAPGPSQPPNGPAAAR